MSIQKIRYLDEIDATGLTKDQYFICGSAACIAHGINNVENTDIDICIDPSELDALEKNIDVIAPHLDYEGSLDIVNFNDDFYKTIVIDGYRFLNITGLEEFYWKLYQMTGKKKFQLQLINIFNYEGE